MPLPANIAAKLGLKPAADATPAPAPEKKGVIPADAPKVLTKEMIEGYAAKNATTKAPLTGQPVGTAVGVVPPDAPAPAKEERKEAAAFVAAATSTPAPAEPVDLARMNGWTDEEIDSMTDEAFVAAQKIRKEDADVVTGTDDQGTFIEAVVEKPKPAPVAAPRRTSRTQAAAPAPAVEPVVETPTPAEEPVAEQAEEPAPVKRKAGRPPVYEQHLKGLYGWSIEQLAKITKAQGVVLMENKIRGEQVSITPNGTVVVLGDEPFRLLPDGTPAPVETPERALAGTKAAVVEPVAAPVEKEAVKKFLTSETKIAGTTGQTLPLADTTERVWSGIAMGLRVFVDILPEKGVESVTLLDDLVKPYMADAAAKYKDEKSGQVGVTHYSLIPFAQGPSRVAAYLLVNPPKGDVFVDSRSPCAAACLEVLRPMADVVYRGVR